MTQGLSASAVRGADRQKIGALITGLGYMTLGLPITLMLIYWLWEDRWLESIWIGPAISSIFVSLAL